MLPIPSPSSRRTFTLPCTVFLMLASLFLLSPLSVQASPEQLLSASHTAGPPGIALPSGGNESAPAALLAPSHCESFLLLTSMDGGVPVVDTPSRKNVRFHLKAGSVVRLINQAPYDGQTWYLISPLDRVGSGWVPQSLVRHPSEVEPTLTASRACTGTRYQPSITCGTTLPLPTSDQGGLWLWAHFIGMNPNDEVQWVLTINKLEHYASPIIPWVNGCVGQTVIDLHTLNPRYEPGFWELRFLVNGKQVSTTGFHIR